MPLPESWHHYKKSLFEAPSLGMRLDLSRMNLPESYVQDMAPAMEKVFDAMEALEAGAIANPDEGRMVGHYWLRNPKLAPTQEIRKKIQWSIEDTANFAEAVHRGAIRPPSSPAFRHVTVVGIGGSALGPELSYRALSGPEDRMKFHFLDNGDPDGVDTFLTRVGEELQTCLCLVISKSGNTLETKNTMQELRHAYAQRGLNFSQHAVVITSPGSTLDDEAQRENFLARFPLWTWVGGRTSLFSTVGLLPAALQGIDTQRLLAGASAMDEQTRHRDTASNPAALLALAWFHAGEGRGLLDMVVLPYKDRLDFLVRYLQQLVMESLGKARDLEGKVVHQGLTVYGNKGSTDQHALVQQLREGPEDFFATFVEVLREREGTMVPLERGHTSGDYLHGFLLGTREALYECGRRSITLSLERIDAFRLGALIALFERAVSFYASLVGINAYHQPGVEAGKQAAAEVLELQRLLLRHLPQEKEGCTVEDLAKSMEKEEEIETIFQLLERLCANPERGVEKILEHDPASGPFGARYRAHLLPTTQ